MAKYGSARVSTNGQAKYGNSLEDQVEKLMEAGVPRENIFCDHCTGTKMDRPEFNKLLGLLKSGDELVVTKLDRLARTAPEGAQLVRDLVDRGITVRVLNMGFADNSTMGRVMVMVMLAFAEFERDMIVERTQAGKEIARRKPGYREGRKPAPQISGEELRELSEGRTTRAVLAEKYGVSVTTVTRQRVAWEVAESERAV